MKKVFLFLTFILTSAICFSQWAEINHIKWGPNTSPNYIRNKASMIMTSDGTGYKVVYGTSGSQHGIWAGIYGTNNDWITDTLLVGFSIINNLDIHFLNDSVGVCNVNDGPSSDVYITKDEGKTWNLWFNHYGIIYEMNLINDSTLFYTFNHLINGATIIRRVGQHASTIYSAGNSQIFLTGNGFHFLDTNYGYVLTRDPLATVAPNILKRTANSGQSWTNTFPQSSFVVTHLNFLNDTVGYFGVNSGHVYRTVNSGTSWRILNTPLSSPINDIEFGLNNSLHISSINGIMYNSTDNGVTWNLDSIGTTKNLIDIYAFNNSSAVYVSTVDGSLYKKGTITTVFEAINETNFSFYPNPAQEYIYFDYDQDNLEVSIYNSIGDLVKICNSKKVDVSNFASGVYYLSIVGDRSQFIFKKAIISR